MIISKIRLFNWKNFHDSTIDLQNRCFIIGANAAGKSNLLDAFRFLRDISKQGGGLQSAVEERGGVKSIRCLSARSRTDVEIEVEISESGSPLFSYDLSFKSVGGGIRKIQASIVFEKAVNLRSGEILLNRSENGENEDEETLKYTYLEQAVANKKFKEIRDLFASIEYLNIVPQMVREASSIMFSVGKEDYYGRNFMERLAKLPDRTRKSYLNRINTVMHEAVPQLEQLSFVKDENGVPHLEARYIHWRAIGSKQRETVFSDGTLRLIGFLFALLDGTGIILIEEPEINLHTEVVKRLPAFISQVQEFKSKSRQIIITTHSYDILADQGIAAEEILLLNTSKEGTNAINLHTDDQLMAEFRAGLPVVDIVLNRTAPKNISSVSLTEK